MKAVLFDDHQVEITPETRDYPGSFYLDRAYSPDALRRLYQALSGRDEPVLIDVGAHTGAFCLLAALLPALRVQAFEPVDVLRAVCGQNLRLNGVRQRVQLYEWAVADYNGFGTLHRVQPDNQLALSMLDGQPAGTKATTEQPVAVVTLDDFLGEGRVDALKVDVEGNELAVLHGAARTIERWHPLLLVEVSQPNTDQYGYHPQRIYDRLAGWGYTWMDLPGADVFCTWSGQ